MVEAVVKKSDVEVLLITYVQFCWSKNEYRSSKMLIFVFFEVCNILWHSVGLTYVCQGPVFCLQSFLMKHADCVSLEFFSSKTY